MKGRITEGSKAPRTLDWYTDYLNSFLDHLRSQEPGRPEVPTLTVDQLRPIHVYRWADSHPEWKTGKRGAMTAVQRAFNWAAKAGLLKTAGGPSPLAGLEKPPQRCRDWKPVRVLETFDSLCLCRIKGAGPEDDEWFGPDRIRKKK